MKYTLLTLTIFLSLNVFSQCNIDVVKVSTQRGLGRNIGYHLTLKNNSNKTVDAVEWTATFTDKFGDVKEVKQKETWSAGNTLTIDTSKPVEPGKDINITMGCVVKGATDIIIKITRVHFTDRTTCKK